MAPFLELCAISKNYAGVRALTQVSLSISKGEVIGLIGENGAGKSTLMKILSGVVVPTEGKVVIDGQSFASLSVRQAMDAGVAFVHQELNLFENLDVAANIFLGRESARYGILNNAEVHRLTEPLLQRLGCDFKASSLVAELSIAQRQQLEIAKALSQGARVIVMDEPTSSLSATETDRLLEIVADLRESGVAVIFISHRLGEIMACADRVLVLRDGCQVGALEKHELSHARMIKLMIGRELADFYVPPKRDVGDVVLEVRDLETVGRRGRRASFSLSEGEILGVAGLIGSGRTEIARALFGIEPAAAGELLLDGKRFSPRHPSEAIDRGIFLVPEDRKMSGVILDQSILHNISLPDLPSYSRFGLVSRRAELENARKQQGALRIKARDLDVRVGNLSGGNQQKVVLAKWLSMNPRILIFDEPTRGVDVGARAEIYALLRELADAGVAVMMISSDLEEVIGVSDRVAVMHEGTVSGILERSELNEEAIMRLAVGRTQVEMDCA